MSRVILALAAIGLVVAVWLSWPDPSADETEPTIPAAASTSSTRALATTSTGPGTTTTGVTTSHVVATVEEAEAILRELWFGWFEGIYNQDEERIREVVGNPDLVLKAVDQFGVMEFKTRPNRPQITFTDTELLRTDSNCLAVWAEVDATELIGEMNDGVHVFVYDGKWLFISQWANRGDLWEDDCDSQL